MHDHLGDEEGLGLTEGRVPQVSGTIWLPEWLRPSCLVARLAFSRLFAIIHGLLTVGPGRRHFQE